MEYSQIFIFLLFGTNTLFALLFNFKRIFEFCVGLWAKCTLGNDVAHPNSPPKKQLSKPFMGTFKCCESLTTELFSVGFIVGLTYIAEKHWYAPHMGKTYSPDFFAFITLVFFALAIYTRKPVTDLALLGRQQSEEWKGWMQYIFLMYHYFHAEDVYNAVRVMITCYVWMTGFGNFSFFYVKRDFGWLRILQMLWRLNFSVLFLMFAHNNTYILYYICPLHTFYFLMVFVCMWIMSDLNHSKWGIRTKLLALGCLIYIIWDVNGGLFNYLFFFAGTEPKVGANGGTLWEWYFRSSLDHWSAFFGMIFALNFPACEAFFKNAVEEGKTGALWVVGAVLSVLSAWWCLSKYPAGKIEYNQTHAYLAFIPLLSYVFFRNITPGVRSAVSESLHDLGKTTLETYLLQHHIWLSSNAKTLLNIVPGMPYVNFFVATTFFVLFSKELYRVSLSLRGMFLPDDAALAFRNFMLMVGVLVALFVFAVILSFAGISTFGPCALVCICLFSATLAAIQLEMLPSEDLRNEIRRRHVEHPLLLPALFAASMLVALYFCAVDLPLYEMAAPKPKTYTTHKMDQSMSKSFEGAVLLSVAAIMIVSMDNFFGLGYLSSRIFGVTWNWAKVYPPLHRKLGVDRSEDVSLELAQNSDQKAEATDSLLTSTNPKDSV